ncbi:hypothetical protein EF879_10475 [Micromonospora sp. HM5-17]|nr:hypothetical protein EF879_10475 [Micromonospora sp. HM5-17]
MPADASRPPDEPGPPAGEALPRPGETSPPDEAPPPAGEVLPPGTESAVVEAGPAPTPRTPAEEVRRYEPAPAAPFRGAAPALGSPWLSAPGTLPNPSAIEPTTGAPLAMLPQRAPRATPRNRPPWNAPAARTGPEAPDTADTAQDDDFWLPIEEVHWDGTPVEPTPRTWYGRPKRRPGEAAPPRPPRPPKPPPHPALGLAGVILFCLVASFFAWVSAEPWWLAVGHGERGTVVVESCRGRGLGLHCRGEFVSTDGVLLARDVRLVGVTGGAEKVGFELPARIIDAERTRAYVGAGTGTLHLHWSLGLGVVLLCTVGTGWCSGALRFPERNGRRRAALVSYAGPLLLTAGFLAAAY